MPLPKIEPPLVNSANPWATSADDLQTLFDCPFTGAVTTRTTLLSGFEHDPSIHQYAFFNPEDHSANLPDTQKGHVPITSGGSLNTLGYSPLPLTTYLAMIRKVVDSSELPEDIRAQKPFIISVTGSPEAVVDCYREIKECQSTLSNPLCMEVNLSCPNIPSKPPPAYSMDSLAEYLQALACECGGPRKAGRVAIGIKTPPYTYYDQFKILIDCLATVRTDEFVVDFITATNTLGSCLVLEHEYGPPILGSSSGTGVGGLGGTPLHPLALGNVKTIKSMIDQHERLHGMNIIGVGGVSDATGYRRMQAVGADVVGVGTALGREGVGIFERISRG